MLHEYNVQISVGARRGLAFYQMGPGQTASSSKGASLHFLCESLWSKIAGEVKRLHIISGKKLIPLDVIEYLLFFFSNLMCRIRIIELNIYLLDVNITGLCITERLRFYLSAEYSKQNPCRLHSKRERLMDP